jgi:hypothetical protein
VARPKKNKAPARKKAKKRGSKKRSKKPAKRKRTGLRTTTAAFLPRKRKGESYPAYHDRLSDLIFEADRAGDHELSAALQAKAGELAKKYKSIRSPRRGSSRKRRGPGTYPWEQCMDDQLAQYGGSRQRAARVCGRIRADSRSRYPLYWAARGLGRRRNPEDADGQHYAIVVDGEGTAWHYWVQDMRKGKLAATSSKALRSEQAAVNAAKRAAKQWEHRYYAPKVAKTTGRKPTSSKSGGRLPSVLTRI